MWEKIDQIASKLKGVCNISFLWSLESKFSSIQICLKFDTEKEDKQGQNKNFVKWNENSLTTSYVSQARWINFHLFKDSNLSWIYAAASS